MTPAEIAGERDRDPFLELLRNVSVLRVVLLHLVLRPPLVYLPWIQWVYPGMPEIFFVSGALAVRSVSRRGGGAVVVRRAKRILLPYVVYAAVALVAMAITDYRSDLPGASLSAANVRSFVLPLTQPTGSPTRAILWSHLWFVTVFLWMVLLTPMLLWLIRRVRLGALALPLGTVGMAVFLRQHLHWNVPSEVGLIGQFGTYYVMGLLAAVGALQVGGGGGRDGRSNRSRWSAIAAACAVAGVFIATVVEPISRKRPPELYSSRSAYLFVGLAWLSLAIACHEPLSAWTRRHPSRLLQTCTQRTFTLYLWGLPADSIGVAVAKRLLPNRWAAIPVYVGVSLSALVIAVLVFGWVEDVSAGRRAQWRPRVVT